MTDLEARIQALETDDDQARRIATIRAEVRAEMVHCEPVEGDDESTWGALAEAAKYLQIAAAQAEGTEDA